MADEQPKKKSKLKWIILFVLLLLFGGAGFVGWQYYPMLKERFFASGESAATEKTDPKAAKPAKPMGATVSLPVFIVNLADPLGQRFVKLSLEVELTAPSAAADMASQNPRIRDSIIMLLSSKTYADIASTQGRMTLKDEVTARLNNILGPGKVRQVFITDMIFQ